jgi:hypothetical protein
MEEERWSVSKDFIVNPDALVASIGHLVDCR